MKAASRFLVPLLLVALTGWASTARARVSLVSVPERRATVIRLDNPQGALVAEERILTLRKGINRVTFSWRDAGVDPDSIRLRFLSHPEGVRLLNISYPPDEPALVWELASDGEFEETVRVSYLLQDLDRLITYRMLADQDNSRAMLRCDAVLRNFSGEDFESSDVMLNGVRLEHLRIRNGETVRAGLTRVPSLRVTRVWTLDTASLLRSGKLPADSAGIPLSYRFENTAATGPGDRMMPAGNIRVYQEDGRGGSVFMGEDRLHAVPVGETAEVRIGDSRDIVVKQKMLEERRTNVRRNDKNKVVLYDLDTQVRSDIRNLKDRPAVLTLIHHIPGQWEMTHCNMDYTLKDAFTLKFDIPLSPGSEKQLVMEYTRKNIRE